MCGIAGFTGSPRTDILTRMVDRLVHRGPDGSGFWKGERASLGMRRLAIVDIESGQQPVFSEDRQIVAVFNGEIYNHKELRGDLEKKGHKFISDHSDSEVIPHLYEEYGEAFLKHLNGMFAIALWDDRKKRLLLARDRCGIKPLFYAIRGGQLAFASEIKSLFEHPGVVKEPDYESLSHYFTFKNTPSPHTAFRDVRQLRAGEMALFENAEFSARRWWKIAYGESSAVSETEAQLEIRRLLEDSVYHQMQTDVGFGAYLSGGIDSSAIVALMSRMNDKPVKTFTLAFKDGFKGKSADQQAALRIAQQYRTEHHEHFMDSKDVLDSLPAILRSFDEPFSGTISTYFLTKIIGQHVKVALSGDGADEMFASYLPHRLAQPLAQIQAGHSSHLEPFENQLPFLTKTFERGNESDRRMGQYVWDDAGKSMLFSDKMKRLCGSARSQSLVDDLYAHSGTRDPLNRALAVDWETLLPDQVLAFVDRLSMAHSVEVRPPFLDHRLVEFVASLPGSFKIRNGRTKHILKEAIADLLPPDLIDRPKEGFVLPVNDWLLNELRPFALAALSSANLDQHGLLNSKFVADLLERHFSGQDYRPNQVWNLICFQMWWDETFGNLV